MYVSKCLYLISEESILPIEQLPMVVNLTEGKWVELFIILESNYYLDLELLSKTQECPHCVIDNMLKGIKKGICMLKIA